MPTLAKTTLKKPALTKRVTIYLDSHIHRALKYKAVADSRSVSAIVDDALRHQLAEDAEDIQACEDRKNEPVLSFAEVVRELKLDGKI